MAKIVYGVSGEGSGHSSRARVVISHLLRKGHEVKVVTYDRGVQNLGNDFDVTETIGLSIITEDNKVSKSKTLAHNLAILPNGENKYHKIKNEIFKKFKPDVVITDFEPQTAYLANHYHIPLITIDNQHRMRYLDHNCPLEMIPDALMTENIIRAMIPRPDYSIIISFYEGKLKNKRSCLTPPILRKEILDLKPNTGNEILIYLTQGYESIIDFLKKYKREKFNLYGYNKDEVDENITYKSFSKDEFLNDLTNAKAVIGTSGFTLMTESFYLGKPFLATPMKGQFEQEFNAFMMEKNKFGRVMKKLEEQTFSAFLYELPDYREKLSSYNHYGNNMVTDKLDELLADDLKLIKEFHNKRTLNHKIESFFDFLDL